MTMTRLGPVGRLGRFAASQPRWVFVAWIAIAIGLGGFFVYLALFAALRTLLKRALVAGMFYTLVVDLAVSRMPAVGAAKLSVWHHLMVIHCSAFEMGSSRVTARLVRTIAPGETFTTSAVTLAAIGLFALVLGMWMARAREYPVAGAVA